MIIVRNLSKSFGSITALKEVSLEIRKGEFYGLLGPNGAGKTTFINILSSVVSADSGSIFVDGEEMDMHTTEIKKKIGVVPQEIALYEDLSAHDNLLFWGKNYGIPAAELKQNVEQLLHITSLENRKNDKVAHFSGGMKRRLNLACALVHKPDIVFMDEPTVGIDPQSRNKIYDILQNLQKEGITTIYTTHYMEEAEKLCNRIGIIDHGQIIAEGTLQQLRKMDQSTESISIQFEKLMGEQKKELVEVFGETTIVNGDTCVISTYQLDLKLAEIISKIDRIGLNITNIDFKKKSLETLFLNLTGKKLRE
ncbi:MAG: ABC transporter ATP-binding protein [Bacteroidales bacterium]|nr:ABC transporter ATP-binding protein [Bacteroidales bacterium]MCF8343398.1 ABC transporter ATP-binding protein [Bacteroidales bacterium]MCF8351767.1 ABC transporter ATP-binding protein [Bacteroidales bacterium]MCF8377569.1 ABC transporter ATP-binding protein [Bacteroidales bacterium]MCF8401700.1 ABC transporter ATP-binding protein [Bacteroidales bacterium]